MAYLLATLAGLAGGFLGNTCWSWWLGRKVGDLCDPGEMGAKPEQVLSHRFGGDTGELHVEERRRGEDPQAGCSPCSICHRFSWIACRSWGSNNGMSGEKDVWRSV